MSLNLESITKILDIVENSYNKPYIKLSDEVYNAINNLKDFNYEKIYNDFFIPNGLGEYDIVNNPELANDPRIGSLLSMGWFAVTDQGARAIASANNYDIRGVTKAINGGYNGLEDRIRRTNELLKQYS